MFTIGLVVLQSVLPLHNHSGRLHASDQVLRAASSALILADWLQTLDGVRRRPEWHESNPVLGAHPSATKVNVLVGSTLLANFLLVPKIHAVDLRTAIWAAVVLVELDAVIENHRTGLRFNFHF